MEGQNRLYERRRHPRFPVDFPIDYHREGGGKAFVGNAVNASEGGLMVCFDESISTGTQLIVSMLFNLGYKFTGIKALCRVIWKDVGLVSDFPGYQYGLEFLDIDEHDIVKLKRLRNDAADHMV